MARARGEFAVAHGAQYPAQRLHGDRDTEFLEYPLHEIDQSPAHYPVDCRDRAVLDQLGERRPMRVVQYRLLAGGLAVDEPVGALRIKAFNPISNNLRSDAAGSAALARLVPS